MLEVVAGRDPLSAAERRVVEIYPRAGHAAVVERHRNLGPRVEAGVGLAGTVALDLIESRQHGLLVEHLVDFAADAAVLRRDGGRIDAEIEQRRLDRPVADR